MSSAHFSLNERQIGHLATALAAFLGAMIGVVIVAWIMS